ncbi:MAG: helix-turn-helix domain-containing protein [Mycoplasmataceae bacterium]|jgi:transcriptional regulator with XRE-family HTH domain|nr:helix-turn-helix domain-containing protein [Mycoplasmataceae bacterium]
MLHSINVGKAIAKYRRINHMSQAELGNIFDVSAQAISRWENGISLPDIISFSVLADIFKTTVYQLISNESYDSEFSVDDKNNRKITLCVVWGLDR